MPKYLNTLTNRVVDRPETYIAVFSDGHYVPVDSATPLYEEPCCGSQDEVYDALDYVDPVITNEKEIANA